MKKWNFFARVLCVMSLCVFASCSSPSGGSSGNGGGSAQPAKCKITYISVIGTAPQSKQVDVGYTLTSSDLSSLNETGYTFNGWKLDGNDIAAGYEINKNIDLTADWTGATGTTVTNIKAGVRPANVTGSQTLPTFTTNITDHLYLAESSANATGYLAAWETKNASTYQWYTGTTGNWQAVSDATTKSLQITATTVTTYYILEAKSEDGNSVAYSNVCTVVCGGDKTTNIGKIAYSDGTCSSEYEAAKTPIGIVFDVNADGTPKKIVNLRQASSKMWSSSSADGSYKNFVTGVDTPLSYTDGSGNWQIICDKVIDENTKGYYPAFEYCNELTDGGKSWYLPARDELMTLYFNRIAVNSAIENLPSGTAIKLPTDGWFWSSSQYASYDISAWFIYFVDGNQGGNYKDSYGFVRGVAGF